MKTAISIPDATYDAAEKMARRLGVSRSELYARAVVEFLDSHRQQDVTRALDSVYGATDSRLDEKIADLQRRSLPGETW